MLLSVFKVVATNPAPRKIPDGKGGMKELVGKNVQAVPLPMEQHKQLAGWFANSANGSIGFAVFGLDAEPFVEGYTFMAPFLPATQNVEVSMASRVIGIPEFGQPKPPEVSIRAGESVIFVALSPITRVVVGDDGKWQSPPLRTAASTEVGAYELTLREPGHYGYHLEGTPQIKGIIHVV